MIDRAILLRESGLSIREIATELDVPRATVGDWVKGVDPLPQAERDIPVDDRLLRAQKVCPDCQQRLPWADYWAAAKWPDGSMRRPQSRCKECVKARRREQRKANPEKAREVNRRDWERIRNDPDQLARRRELTRENGVVHRRRRGGLTWDEYLERRRAS